MLQLLALRWWALALRGVIAVLFGLLTFFIPGVTLISLVLLFGFYAILDGIFDIVSAMKAPGHHWPLLVEGIVGIVPAPELPPVRSVSEGSSLCPSMRDSCGLENKIRR